MKVLHITAWWPSRVHPTHGNFIQKHVRLVAHEHEVVVVAVQEDPSLRYGHYEIIHRRDFGYDSIIVYFGPARWGLKPLSLAARLHAYFRGIRRCGELFGRRPDLIHGHILIDGGLVAAVVAKWWGIPQVITEHATIYQHPAAVSAWRIWLGRWACREAARLMPVSEYLATAMQEHYRLRGYYTVVPNVVRSDTFRLPLTLHDRPHLPFRLLHVSNFHPRQKNVAGMLRVHDRLCSAYPGRFELHIAGDGPVELIRKLVHELGLDSKAVTLTGPHTELEVAELMAEADAFVLFSNYETQGVVLLEALCCGLPCIASAVGGVTEVISSGQNGLLVPVADEDALFWAIVKLADTYSAFDATVLRDSAVGRYGDDAVLAELSGIYGEVTTGPLVA